MSRVGNAEPGRVQATGRPGGTRRIPREVALVLMAALTVVGCTPLDDAMAAIFGRHMRSSVSFDPYENPRSPADNAVPFASGNYPAAPGQVNVGQPEGLEDDVPPMAVSDVAAPPGTEVVRTLENPVSTDSASLARGRELYDRFCAVCHAANGIGTEAPIVDKLPMMNAFNLATGNPVGYPDGYIYGMIRVGRGVMPAYGDRIAHFDRWHLVNYVRQLQREAGALPVDGGSDGGQGEPAPGELTPDEGGPAAGQDGTPEADPDSGVRGEG